MKEEENEIREDALKAARNRFKWKGYGSTVNLFSKKEFDEGVAVKCYYGHDTITEFEKFDMTKFEHNGTAYMVDIYRSFCTTCKTPVYVAVYFAY